MKKRIKKRLSFLLLTLLGFSTACEKQKNGEPPTAMYGTPHVNIWVGGKVTDKTGTPIPGIEVRQPNSSYKAQTGDDGCYELPGQLFSIETTADILFTDTDGRPTAGSSRHSPFRSNSPKPTASRKPRDGAGAVSPASVSTSRWRRTRRNSPE